MNFKNTPDINKQTSYRKDIDGLRAIAVLSVILFHIDKSWLPGGFVGVDIFFVISGYLISLHIFKDIEANRFSLAEFYRRRIKRIAPAMFVVVAVTVVLAQFIMLPEDAEKTAESGLWAIASLANVYYWLFQDTSYFAAASNELPLLNLWSLGVEEQFYLFWPLILMLLYKGNSKVKFTAVIVLVIAFSFVLGEVMFTQVPSFVYYMLPTRAAELLLGALIALFTLSKFSKQYSKLSRNALVSVSFLLIACSMIFLDEHSIFPGLNAIPPTVGAALLILVGGLGRNWTTYLLTSRYFLWVGVISYSAYLWHWPILAFLRYGQFDMTLTVGMSVLIVTFLLAWLTYHFVEQPCRKVKWNLQAVVIKQFMLPAAVFGVIFIVFMKLDGYGLSWADTNYRLTLQTHKESIRPSYDDPSICLKPRISAKDLVKPECRNGHVNVESDAFLLWGDSNAAHYVGILDVFGKSEGYSFRNIEAGSCSPGFDNIQKNGYPTRIIECNESQKIIRSLVDDYSTLVLSASWVNYIGLSSDYLSSFGKLIDEFEDAGKKIILIGKAPIFENFNRNCDIKKLRFPFVQCEAAQAQIEVNVLKANKAIEQLAATRANTFYIDFNQFLCPNDLCSTSLFDGKSIYFDNTHISVQGSVELGKMIVQQDKVPTIFKANSFLRN